METRIKHTDSIFSASFLPSYFVRSRVVVVFFVFAPKTCLHAARSRIEKLSWEEREREREREEIDFRCSDLVSFGLLLSRTTFICRKNRGKKGENNEIRHTGNVLADWTIGLCNWCLGCICISRRMWLGWGASKTFYVECRLNFLWRNPSSTYMYSAVRNGFIGKA